MKKLLGKVKADMACESLGVAMTTFGVAQFSIPAAWIFIGAFLIWLVESAN